VLVILENNLAHDEWSDGLQADSLGFELLASNAKYGNVLGNRFARHQGRRDR